MRHSAKMNKNFIQTFSILYLLFSAFNAFDAEKENHVISVGQDMELVCKAHIGNENITESTLDLFWYMEGESNPLPVLKEQDKITYQIVYATLTEKGCYTCFRKTRVLRKICINVIEHLEFSESTSQAVIAVPRTQESLELTCGSQKNATGVEVVWLWDSFIASRDHVLPIDLTEYFESNAKVTCSLVTGKLVAKRTFQIRRLAQPNQPIINDAVKSGQSLTIHWQKPFVNDFRRIDKFYAVCKSDNITIYNDTIFPPTTNIYVPSGEPFSCDLYAANTDFSSSPANVNHTLFSQDDSSVSMQIVNITSTTVILRIQPKSGLKELFSSPSLDESHILCYASSSNPEKQKIIVQDLQVQNLDVLTPNSEYVIKLRRGTNCSENSTLVASVLAHTKPKNFPKPEDLVLQALSSDVAIFRWRSLAPVEEEAHHYQVWLCADVNSKCESIKGGMMVKANQETRSLRIDGLKPHMKYFFSVKERSSTCDRYSVFSDILEFSTEDSTSLPRNLTFLKLKSSFLFSWLPPLDEKGVPKNISLYKIIWYCFTGGHTKLLRLSKEEMMSQNISMYLNNSELCSKFYFTVCAVEKGRVCRFADIEVENPIKISIIGWIIILFTIIFPVILFLQSYYFDKPISQLEQSKPKTDEETPPKEKNSFNNMLQQIAQFFHFDMKSIKSMMKSLHKKNQTEPTSITDSQLVDLKTIIQTDKNCEKVHSSFCWCYKEVLDNMTLWDFVKLREEFNSIKPIQNVYQYKYNDSALMPCEGTYFQGSNDQRDYGVIKPPSGNNFNKFWILVHYRKIKLVIVTPTSTKYTVDMFEKMIEADNMSMHLKLYDSYERNYNTFATFAVSEKYEPSYSSNNTNQVMVIIPKITKLHGDILYHYMYEVMYHVHYIFHRQTGPFFTIFIDENMRYSSILMAIDIVIRRSLTCENVSVPSVVYDLRIRYPALINRFNDYCSIYEVANEFICLPEYDLNDGNILESRNAFLEFIQLNLISHGSTKVAIEDKNMKYNKSHMYLPYNHNRVKLSNEFFIEEHDYVNASLVSMPHTPKQIILAQAPFDEMSMERFWDMVWTVKTSMVINMVPVEIMTGLVDKHPIYDYSCAKFCNYNPYQHIQRDVDSAFNILQCRGGKKSPNKNNKASVRNLRMTYKKETREIQYITVESSNHGDLVERITEVAVHYQQFEFNHPIVIMCSSGSELSAIVASTIYASIQSSQMGFFNIGHIIRCIKRQRKNTLMCKAHWSVAFESAQLCRINPSIIKSEIELKPPKKCGTLENSAFV